MICEDILKLTEYGMVTGLVPKEDERFTINRLLELFELEELDEDAVTATEKIDGAVATVMALDRAIRNEGSDGSVYDDRGILVF